MLDTAEEAIVMSIQHFLDSRKHAADLETCLIVNQTRRQFITSDDPAIHTNRFHFQKMRSSAFVLGSAGAMLYLPLSPKLAFMAFDGNIYLAPSRQGEIIPVKRDDEISAINELQLLHARQNLYYADTATGEFLAADFKQHAAARPIVWHKFTYFEKAGNSSKGEYFERVDRMALETGREFLTSFQMVHARPSRWMGLLKYRLRPRFVDTGTAAGYLRPNDEIVERYRNSVVLAKR